MELGRLYLDCVLEGFQGMKRTGERAMEQLNIQELNWAPNEECNSVALIVKHMAGNMRSRWANFLTTDGEKPGRNRDEEFEGGYGTREEMTAAWEAGWQTLFHAMASLRPEELQATVTIRAQPLSVVQAIERQVAHLSHHVGQIVYLAKQIKGVDWENLSIERGKSQDYLEGMTKRFQTKST